MKVSRRASLVTLLACVLLAGQASASARPAASVAARHGGRSGSQRLHVVRAAGVLHASYAGHGAAGGVTFLLDGAAVAADARLPYRLTLFRAGNDGAHSLVVRSLRTGRRLAFAGLRAPGAAGDRPAGSYVAAGAPVPPITVVSRPADATAAPGALIAWATTGRAQLSERCSLDGAAYAPCGSPARLTRLRPGPHSFSVRTSAAAGANSAAVGWTVLPAARGRRTVAIGERPGAETTSPDALFAWTQARGGAVCSLDGGPARPCSSPTGYLGLRPGAHRFRVASGRAASTVSWIVQRRTTPPPTVAIAAAPGTPTSSTSASIPFRATGAATATCSLDGAQPAPCRSPAAFSGLAVRGHTLSVTVANGAGSATASVSWTVQPLPTADHPCGVAASPPSTYQHVVWIVMENHAATAALSPASAPYTVGLTRACGLATSFTAESHPSLPNYVAMTSGSTQGIKDDNGPSSHPLAVPSIFSQTAGSWRALQESMPANCSSAGAATYAVRHNPAAYYTGIRGECATNDVPLGAVPDLSARFTFVTPNLCNDTHSCPVATGDAWLSRFLPQVFGSPQYQSGTTAVFLTWDEDDGSAGNHVATIVMAPSVPAGIQVATPFTHYSLLRTTEELLGIPGYLGGAATATSMRGGFHL
jgi:hypothetical protein